MILNLLLWLALPQPMQGATYPCLNTTAQQLPGKTLWLKISQAAGPFETTGMYGLTLNANGTYNVAPAAGIAARSGTWQATNWNIFTNVFVDVVLENFFGDARQVKVFVDHCYYEIHFIPQDDSHQYGMYTVTDGEAPAAEPPALSASPNSQTRYTGETVTLDGGAMSTEAVHYQWFKDNQPIAWGLSPSLTLTNLTFADAGSYKFVGSNSLGSVTSSVAVLTVQLGIAPSVPLPMTFSQVTNLVGGTFYLYAQAKAAPLTGKDVRWYRDSSLLGTAENTFSTGPSNFGYFNLIVTNAQPSHSGNYFFVASNLLGQVTSAPVAVLITNATAPAILTNLFLWPYPTNDTQYTVFPAYNYTLAAKANGTPPLGYYWYKDGLRITNTYGGGAPNPSSDNVLIIPPGVGSWNYQVVVSNIMGSVTGAPVALNVLPDYPVITKQTTSFTNLYGSSNLLSFEYYTYVSISSILWQYNGSTWLTTNASGTNYAINGLFYAGNYTARLLRPGGQVYDTAPITITVTNGPIRINSFTPSQTQYFGGTFTFTVDYTMGSPYGANFYWYKDGQYVGLNNSPTYYLNNLTATNSGGYTVVLSNQLGSVTSQVSQLTVQAPPPPIITNPPASMTVYAGSNVTLNVGFINYATGTPIVSWYKTNTLLQASTTPSYTLYNITTNQSGGYYAAVANTSGSSTSDVAVLNVVLPPAPTITNHPQSLSVYAGSNVTFTVGYQNASPLAATVSWYRGATVLGSGNTLYVYNVTTNSAGAYYAVVSNNGGATTSAVANLTVTLPPLPIITSHPQSATNYPGGSVTFTVGYTNDAPAGVTLNWLFNGRSLNFNSTGYIVSSLTTNNVGNYQAVVSNTGGSVTSQVATLTLVAPPAPAISNQPVSIRTNWGAYTYFQVDVINLDPKGVGYQWYKNGAALAGQIGYYLYFNAARFADAADYFVVVTNNGGVVTSKVATLTVEKPAAPSGVDNLFFPEDGPNTTVNALLPAPDGSVYAGGLFTLVGATNRYGLAQFATNGGLNTNFANALASGSQLYALQSGPTGSVIVGGYTVSPFYSLGRMMANGSNDLAFNTNGNGLFSSTYKYIYALAPVGQRTLVGGYFTAYNGISRSCLALLESNGQLVTNFNPQLTATYLHALAVQPDGKILIGGIFTRVGPTNRSNLARLNADGTLDLTFNTNANPNSTVNAIALQPDGKILIGGDFTTVSGTNRNRIARLNPDGGLDLTFTNGTGFNGSVYTIASLPTSGKVIVGGYFTTYNSTNRNYLARLNADGTIDTSFSPVPNNAVTAMSLNPDGTLWIGGDFTQISGTPRPRIAKLYADPPAVSQLKMNKPVFVPGSSKLNFDIPTVPGRVYAVQFMSTLKAPTWTNAFSFVGDGTTRSVTNTLSGTAGFYRVLVAP